MDDLTQLLNRLSGERNVAADQLLPLVYQELRRVAAQKMARETPGQTLQATALVHEAWMRVGGESQSWESRAHFFGAAAEAMRRILIDRARNKRAARHGGGQERVNADDVEIIAPVQDDELLAVHDALDQFAARDAQKAELFRRSNDRGSRRRARHQRSDGETLLGLCSRVAVSRDQEGRN